MRRSKREKNMKIIRLVCILLIFVFLFSFIASFFQILQF